MILFSPTQTINSIFPDRPSSSLTSGNKLGMQNIQSFYCIFIEWFLLSIVSELCLKESLCMGVSSKLLLDATGTQASELDSIYSLSDRGTVYSWRITSLTLWQYVWDAAGTRGTVFLGELYRKKAFASTFLFGNWLSGRKTNKTN